MDTTFPTNADRRVHSIALQPDGKVLLGGFFSTVGGIGQKHLARFHGDGTPDTSFTPNVNSNVLAIALQPDEKILVGGTFTNINGEIRNRIARLQPDGSLDADFNPGATDLVTELAVQSDGKIMVTGFFGGLGGRCRSRLGRLHPNGTVESRPWPQISKPALLSNGTFQLSFFGDRYRSIVVQASTNLTQWQSIGSYCCAPVYFSFPDFQATNHPRRFYRLYVP